MRFEKLSWEKVWFRLKGIQLYLQQWVARNARKEHLVHCLASVHAAVITFHKTLGPPFCNSNLCKFPISPLSLPFFIFEPSLSFLSPQTNTHIYFSLSLPPSQRHFHERITNILFFFQNGERCQADEAQVSSEEAQLIQQTKRHRRRKLQARHELRSGRRGRFLRQLLGWSSPRLRGKVPETIPRQLRHHRPPTLQRARRTLQRLVRRRPRVLRGRLVRALALDARKCRSPAGVFRWTRWVLRLLTARSQAQGCMVILNWWRGVGWFCEVTCMVRKKKIAVNDVIVIIMIWLAVYL